MLLVLRLIENDGCNVPRLSQLRLIARRLTADRAVAPDQTAFDTALICTRGSGDYHSRPAISGCIVKRAFEIARKTTPPAHDLDSSEPANSESTALALPALMRSRSVGPVERMLRYRFLFAMCGPADREAGEEWSGCNRAACGGYTIRGQV